MWKKYFKITFRVLLIAVPLLVLLLVVGVWYYTGTAHFQKQVEGRLSRALDSPVTTEKIRFQFPGPIRVEGVQVESLEKEEQDFFQLETIEIYYRLKEVLQGRLGRVVLKQPQVYLRQDSEGNWNIPPGLLEGEGGGMHLPEVDIAEGQVTIEMPEAKYQIEDINLSLERKSAVTDPIQTFKINSRGNFPLTGTAFYARGKLIQEGRKFSSQLNIRAPEIPIETLSRQFLDSGMPEGLRWPEGIVSATADIRTGTDRIHYQLQTSVQNFFLKYEDIPLNAPRVEIQTEGWASADQVVIHSGSMESREIIEGSFNGKLKLEEPQAEGEVNGNLEFPHLWALAGSILPSTYIENIGSVTGSGRLKFNLTFREGTPQGYARFNVSSSTAIIHTVGRFNGFDSGAVFQLAEGRISTLSGSLKLQKMNTSAGSGSGLEAVWEAELPDWDRLRGKVETRINQFVVDASPYQDFPLHHIKSSMEIEAVSSEQRVVLKEGSLKADRLPEVFFSGQVENEPVLSGFLDFKTGLTALEDSYADWEKDFPENWRGAMLSGSTGLEARLDFEKQPGVCHLKSEGKFNLSDFSFFSADASSAANGVAVDMSWDLQGRIPAAWELEQPIYSQVKQLDWNLSGEFKAGEILKGVIYHKLESLTLKADSSGTWLSEGEELKNFQAKIKFLPAGGIDISGSATGVLSQPEADIKLKIEQLDLQPLDDQLLTEQGWPVERLPLLEKVDIQGRMSGDLEFSGSLERWRTEGEIHWVDGLAGWRGEPLLVADGLNLHVPFRIGPGFSGRSGTNIKDPIARFEWDSLAAGPLSLSAGALEFVLFENDFYLPSPQMLLFYGGRLQLEEVEFRQFFSENKSFTLDVQMSDVEMEKIALDMGLPPLTGGIQIRPPRLETNREGDLVSKSDGFVEAFDGRLDIEEMGVEDILSATPTYYFSGQFSGIDLNKITTVLQYGEVSGIVEGHVRDVSFRNGKMREMDFEIKSAPSRGVEQKISADAASILASMGRKLDPAQSALLHQYEYYDYRTFRLGGEIRNGRLFFQGVREKNNQVHILTSPWFGNKLDIVLYVPPEGLTPEKVVENLMSGIERAKGGGVEAEFE